MNIKKPDVVSVMIGLTVSVALVMAVISLNRVDTPPPSLQQVQEMKAQCGQYGYTPLANVNAFNQVVSVSCIDELGHHIRVEMPKAPEPSTKQKWNLWGLK